MKKTDQAASKKLNYLQQLAADFEASFGKHQQEAQQWLANKSLKVGELRHKSNKFLTAASLAGSMLTQNSVNAQALEQLKQISDQRVSEHLNAVTQDEFNTIMDKMKAFVTMPVGHLENENEMYLEQQLTDMLGFEVTAELDGHRLNHSIGIMGGEQHLFRFPGDDLSQHDAYQEAGIAPARGAFGWFANGSELSEADIIKEKYYFAVQTLYLPDWNTNHAQLKPWYKFRKMIAINPADGLAVVGVVGDAGPALWVKKQFGGSPEVIREAKIWNSAARGRVILLFVDDPQDKVPLGVINLNELSPEVLANVSA